MRIIDCLVVEHDLTFVLLAALMCLVGSIVTASLFRRSLQTDGLRSHGWIFLTAVCSGSAIWVTHFIAMLGYQVPVAVTFDPVLTLGSILVAIGGTGAGFAMGRSRHRPRTGIVIGGGLLGLSIVAMHYVGMFAYRVEGLVTWDGFYIGLSVVLAVLPAIAFVALARRWREGLWAHAAAGCLVLSIVGLHFTAMAAFQVTRISGLADDGTHSAFRAIALAVLLVGLIIVGTGVSSFLIDDRTRADSNEKLRRMAFHDPLTGLSNRRALQDGIVGNFSADLSFSLLLVDVDRFKSVNDTFGHATGDGLLVSIAERIHATVPDALCVARIGGDELAILLAGEEARAEGVARALVAAMAEPFLIGDHVVASSVSIGLCGRTEASDPEGLMQMADVALYEAKRGGRGRAFSYRPGMAEAAAEARRLEADLRLALETGNFQIAYQPIVAMDEGRTIGFEALVRWNDPERGLVPPDRFIPLAEANGMIVDLGAFVLSRACKDAAAWGTDQFVAVNVSAVQLSSPRLMAHVVGALAASGLPAHRLEIELTETAIVANAAQVGHVLAGLRTLGVRVAMDDFGTGYSSLAHLRDLPLDRIKIDRSFVSSASTDPNSLAVLRAVTQLGRDIGIETLGEGVETQEQLALLRDLGCRAAQGYLLGRPDFEVRDAAWTPERGAA
ncbi:putative bifunctional diguanylate cyclase/phosphodiesterase [Aureimonas jatrophae]|uniref:Diguanylate cyclase (GGDEF) domain-containing protein n=1 Tax=Aureimonas jatrophae TaxID=1166073 RepID=A0A1H0IL13_9HYPH|nr:EAL domain-containing protein [Aureimonas jatrophae]MBB3952237.1 diguanylate cyclase (GGDEF)-like protein [Aureimonas jatrophae]SDO32174.1 diguanylate cyclase (GGDEF) domain-containing protein [Aureimonas jatrophae]